MSVDLEKLGKMVDEALANETKESLTEWLDERRQNAETEESNCTIHSVSNSLLSLDGKTMPVTFHVSKFEPKIDIDLGNDC